ncbi:transposase family protein [Paraburkholderia flagellata]|uniref:transposase family protein n=1 Tax=Paraburkholderia flagellata TaxID=2883241 RepID=UPI001F36BF44|nr:transposase family protein [Paraburkholderia flagellata]
MNARESADRTEIQEWAKPGFPLSDQRLSEVLEHARVTSLGQALVRQIRLGQPDSTPRGDREVGNVTGRYPSTKMGRVMTFGSVSLELTALLYADNHLCSPDVLEFWNRVRLRGIDTVDSAGRRTGTTSHLFHALVIETARVYFFEVRQEEKLNDNSLYAKRDDQSWYSPSIDAALVRYGIGHVVLSERQLGGYLAGNCAYLARCYDIDYRRPQEEEVERVCRDVRNEIVTSRRKLIQSGHSPEAIKFAIAHGLVYFPITERDLRETEIVFVYRDHQAFLAHKLERAAQGALAPRSIRPLPVDGQEFQWDGKSWHVLNAGRTSYSLRQDTRVLELDIAQVRDYCARNAWNYDVPEVPRIMRVSEKRRSEAFAIFELINRPIDQWIWPYGKRAGKPIRARTREEKIRRVRLAQVQGTSPVEALLTSYDNCGSHISRTDGEYEIWRTCLDEDFLTDTAPSPATITGIYTERCRQAGVRPVSRETIRKRIKALDFCMIVREQDGKFAAYPYGDYVPHGKVNRLVKGKIPMEVAHIDHTPLPVNPVCAITGAVAKREVWRSKMVDACSGRVLAHVMHYGPPGYETLYRLLIECVRRNNDRLPQIIVCDRALEFKAKQFEDTIARYGVIKLNRRSRSPRDGQPVESSFRADDAETTMNISGYRKPDVDYRALLDEFDPKKTALHTMTEIRNAFDEKYYERAPRNPSSRTRAETIVEFENRILSEVGTSHIPVVENNEEFVFLCMPAIRGGYRKVTRRGSIRALNLEYFHPRLREPDVVGQWVLIRYDPDSIGRVIVWVAGRWEECFSDYYELLSQLTHMERLAYQEYLRTEGQAMATLRRERARDFAAGILKMRETAEGKLIMGMALENQGKTSVGDTDDPDRPNSGKEKREPVPEKAVEAVDLDKPEWTISEDEIRSYSAS